VAVTGDVVIPQATVNLREIPPSASVRSSDVIIVGRRAAPRPTGVLVKDAPLDIQPNVSITLGDKVKFNGFGLDARLEGKLRVLRTRQDIVAEGVLSVVDGVYKAYGQNLAIERGRLLFNGALDNPGLDVRAVREVVGGDIKVGMALAGTVRKPESTLFSSPQQTQSDTLSYLLTGRAMSGLSGDQSSLLVDAVTQLGVAGGESLVQQLGGSLGLDDVGLNSKSGDISQSELSLGKRLGPRLYVRYIVSLFDSLQRVALTYQVNKRLQVEVKSGIHQSVDLIYKIDTNKGPLGP
jgi:translocation and assembly module TamB